MRLSLFFVPKELYLLIGLIPNRLIKQEQLSCFKRQIWEVTIGVVVNPVRLESLEKFGSPQFVADKLVQAEKRKVAVCYDSSVTVLKVILVAAELGCAELMLLFFL